MNLRRAMVEFVAEGRVLLERLRSQESEEVDDSELHILRVQLSLLDNLAANLQELKRQPYSKTTAAEFEEEIPRLEEPSSSPIIPPLIPPPEPV